MEHINLSTLIKIDPENFDDLKHEDDMKQIVCHAEFEMMEVDGEEIELAGQINNSSLKDMPTVFEADMEDASFRNESANSEDHAKENVVKEGKTKRKCATNCFNPW